MTYWTIQSILILIYHKSTTQRSIKFTGCKLWNDLPSEIESIRELSVKSLSKKIKTLMMKSIFLCGIKCNHFFLLLQVVCLIILNYMFTCLRLYVLCRVMYKLCHPNVRGCRPDDRANSWGLDSWSFRSLPQEKPHSCTYLLFLVSVVFLFYISVFFQIKIKDEKKKKNDRKTQ